MSGTKNGNQITEQTATVDWLTVTVKDRTKQGYLADEAMRLMDVKKTQGYSQKPWRFKGYEGWVCGGLRWGARNDGSILMLSGQDASCNWPVGLAWADNCTRVDLAVTVQLLEPKRGVASSAYDHLVIGTNNAHKTRKLTYIVNSDGGETFYLGSRASDQYGRLYDKGAEMGDDADVPVGLFWRYEVEFKSYRAQRVSGQLLEAAKAEGNYHQQLGQTVYKWFLSRGVSPIFSAYGTLPFSTEVYAKVSDDDVTLRWLSTQVAPSVERLARNGKREQALEALGLIAD